MLDEWTDEERFASHLARLGSYLLMLYELSK